MSCKETILVWGNVDLQGWTKETEAAIEQAANLAQSCRSRIHLVTVLSTNYEVFCETSDNPLALYPDIEALWEKTSQQLAGQDVKSSYSLMHVSQQNVAWPPGHPAPIQVAMMGVPVEEPESLPEAENSQIFDVSQVQMTLETCRDDVWLATYGAFDRDVPCVIVYDDLGANGEQAIYEAVKTAQNLNSRLLVVHAIGDENQSNSVQQIEHALSNRLSRTDFRTLSHGTRLFVQHGESERVLLNAAQEFEASLVIISWPEGPLSLHQLDGFLKAISRERCSLLLVRSSETSCLASTPVVPIS